MRDLAVQARNGSNSTAARSAAQAEFAALASEIQRVGSATRFGTLNILTGGNFTFQIGANAGDTITVAFFNLVSNADVVAALGASVGDAGAASAAISALDAAIRAVSRGRGDLGAVQNRFESTINSLQVATENVAASESRIRDADMALEMTAFTRNQIMVQAGTAMLGQANQLPQSVLRLLG
jgi:flagellin